MVFFSPLEQFDAIFFFHLSVCDLNSLVIADFSLMHIILPLILLITIYYSMTKFISFFSLIPTTIYQILIEYKLKFIFNLIKQQLGFIGFKYIILFFSIFFFVLILNLLSLLPFGIALTSHLIIILYFSLSICIGIFFEGNISLNTLFYNLFLPKSPLIMLPLLLGIEIFSFIIRMFSLAIRLVANIMAGHTLIYIIATFTLLIFNLNYFLLFVGISFICVIMLLELGVACLQAYVFTILVLIYTNDIFGSSH
jgi:ATP synthase subunit 6